MLLLIICLVLTYLHLKRHQARFLEKYKYFYSMCKSCKHKLSKHSQSSKIYWYFKILSTKFICFGNNNDWSRKARYKKRVWKIYQKWHKFKWKILNVLSFEDHEWILNYLSSGKGIILYEIKTRFDSLDITIP